MELSRLKGQTTNSPDKVDEKGINPAQQQRQRKAQEILCDRARPLANLAAVHFMRQREKEMQRVCFGI